MVKTTKQEDVSVGRRKTVSDALNYVDREFGSWFLLGGKVALVFGAWLSLMLLARWHFTSPDMLQLVAIGYWFGWIFVVASVVLGAAVAASGLLDRVTRMSRTSKY